MPRPGKERVTVEVSPEMKSRAEKLARFSTEGTLRSFVSEALQEKIDREWPALEPLIRVVEQRQGEGNLSESDRLGWQE